MIRTSPMMPCELSRFPIRFPTRRDRRLRRLLPMNHSKWLVHFAVDRNPIDIPAIGTEIVERIVQCEVKSKCFCTFNAAAVFRMADGFCNRIRFVHKLLPYAKYMNVARLLG